MSTKQSAAVSELQKAVKKDLQAMIRKIQVTPLYYDISLYIDPKKVSVKVLHQHSEEIMKSVIEFTVGCSLRYKNIDICETTYTDYYQKQNLDSVILAKAVRQSMNHNALKWFSINPSILCEFVFNSDYDCTWLYQGYNQLSSTLSGLLGQSIKGLDLQTMCALAKIINQYVTYNQYISPNVQKFLIDMYDRFSDWVLLEHIDFMVKFKGKHKLPNIFFEKHEGGWRRVNPADSGMAKRLELIQSMTV